MGAGRLETIPNSFRTGDGGIAQRQLPPPASAGESGLSGLSASWWYWSQIRQEWTVLYILFISVHFYNIAYIGQAKETNLTSWCYWKKSKANTKLNNVALLFIIFQNYSQMMGLEIYWLAIHWLLGHTKDKSK